MKNQIKHFVIFKNVNRYDTIIQWQTLEKASSIW